MAMDSSYLWFRLTQVVMKAGPILVTLVLLAPLAAIFWRMAGHQPKSEAETRAELEQVARQQLAHATATSHASDAAAQALEAQASRQVLEQAKQDVLSSTPSGESTSHDWDKRIADLEDYLQSKASLPPSPTPDNTFTGIIVTAEERVFLTPGTASWFSLYPRRWVGIVGLAATTLIFGLVVWSATVPSRPPVSVDASDLPMEGQSRPASAE